MVERFFLIRMVMPDEGSDEVFSFFVLLLSAKCSVLGRFV